MDSHGGSWFADFLTDERTAEQMRRVAARFTHATALRCGRDLDMWIGCGFPKSGTVWLCQLMSAYLDKPYPRNYQAPVLMSAVVHAHWRWDERMPPTVYIVRDGRDVMVSLYFHHVRMLSIPRNPRRGRKLRKIFDQLYGPSFDPHDIRENLPKFIEYEMSERATLRGSNWGEHVRDWHGRDHVAVVRYEDLLADTANALHRAMVDLNAPRQDVVFAELAARRFEFKRASGRSDGEEDRSSFLRKGVAGDWVNHFTREAVEAFDSYAGDTLLNLGYVDSKGWGAEL